MEKMGGDAGSKVQCPEMAGSEQEEGEREKHSEIKKRGGGGGQKKRKKRLKKFKQGGARARALREQTEAHVVAIN